MERNLETVDVGILAGGLGTRIRSVLGDTPKVLAPVAGRPFLDYLLDWLERQGVRRVVLCLGYGAEQVLMHLRSHPRSGMETIAVVEPAPLGTAGALRFARSSFHSDPVMILNGDTFIDVDLRDFLAEHLSVRSDLSLLCVEVDSTARFGRVDLDEQGRIHHLTEKSPHRQGAGLINGGIYLFSAAMLERLAESTGASLERDFFARLPESTLRGVVRRASFIDIGVPESLRQAESVLRLAAGTGASNPGRFAPLKPPAEP